MFIDSMSRDPTDQPRAELTIAMDHGQKTTTFASLWAQRTALKGLFERAGCPATSRHFCTAMLRRANRVDLAVRRLVSD